MKPRPRIYIAGPITKGDPLHNARQADEAMFALMRNGLAPMNPMLTAWAGSAIRSYDGGAEAKYNATPAGTTHEDWMGADLPWVAASAAVLRLPGESKGADIETQHATDLGIPVFTSVTELVTHFRTRIDPDNPSTVPADWRPSMIKFAEADSTALQMLTDLLALAQNDGCIAAGWALQKLGITRTPRTS
jgi:hypothetical protein